MARKILLADDSVTAQNMGRKILTDAGYEVMTVNNGSAALKRVTEQKPELIVLDVYMPGYSGLEVCQRLKDSRETSRIPVLLTVGKLEPFKPEDARRVGADAFIVKPFEASELLSALTRLEDRIVPQGDGSRFATTVSGIERFAGDPAVKNRGAAETGDQGWKSRLRFPSKKAKKEEPEPEPDYVAPSGLRELGEAPAKKTAKATAPAEVPAERKEPGLVPDIPRDITPDELDALSALVAKLDGPIPQAEEIAPIGDKISPSAVTTEEKAEVAASSSPQAAAPPAPIAEPAAASEAGAQNAEVTPAAEPKPETITAVAAASAAKSVEPPSEYASAPIDRDDEPFFATAASAVPEPAVEREVSSSEQSTSPLSEVAETEVNVPEQVSPPTGDDQQPLGKDLEKEKDQSRVEEIVAEAVAEEAVAEKPISGEDRVPTDEELAEALRLLTPVHDRASAHPHPGNGSRWTAEAVELTPEEVAISLEAEMFRLLAPASVSLPASAPDVASETPGPVPTQAAQVAEIAPPAQPPAPETVDTSATAELADEPAESEMKDEVPLSEGIGQPPTQEPVPTTFASQYAGEDSEGKTSIQSGSEMAPEPVSATGAALGTHEEATGDQQSMAKNGKTNGKGSKSGWHQIHAAAQAATTDVEAAKQSAAETPADESPKTMAAAAASDDASSAAAPDPNAIASIVDSVLADLRPRIVEEIAKKLAKK